jgi:hypothetical protein
MQKYGSAWGKKKKFCYLKIFQSFALYSRDFSTAADFIQTRNPRGGPYFLTSASYFSPEPIIMWMEQNLWRSYLQIYLN